MDKENLEKLLVEYGVQFTDVLSDRLLKEFACQDNEGVVNMSMIYGRHYSHPARPRGENRRMDDLSRSDVIDILLNEMECVQRASDDECKRDCAKCDLLRDTDKILQAYRIAIKALEHPEENVAKIIPHGDSISRQAVINLIRGCNSALQEPRIFDCHNAGIIFEQYITELKPSAEKTDWIPCEDRLPDKDGDYLVCYEQGYKEDYDLPEIGIAGFEVDCESFGYWYEQFDHHTLGCLGSEWEEIKVIAWMPLPETYRAEGSDQE